MDAKRHEEIGAMLAGRQQHSYGAWHQALVDCLVAAGHIDDDERAQLEARSDLTERQWRDEVGRVFRGIKPEAKADEGGEKKPEDLWGKQEP
jgi:hypothetical protein